MVLIKVAAAFEHFVVTHWEPDNKTYKQSNLVQTNTENIKNQKCMMLREKAREIQIEQVLASVMTINFKQRHIFSFLLVYGYCAMKYCHYLLRMLPIRTFLCCHSDDFGLKCVQENKVTKKYHYCQ